MTKRNRLVLPAILSLFLISGLAACSKKRTGRMAYFPKRQQRATAPARKENVWVFLMAGQSNMAGRGMVEPQDTMPIRQLLTINSQGQLILAKEPLHFYEPGLTGLDCGYSFGKTLLKNIPDSVSVILIPTAIGGSAISQWLGDSMYRNVRLFSNFREKVATGKEYGTIKAVLWHQGESDANPEDIMLYQQRLAELVKRFRSVVGDDQLPVLFGELGSFSNDKENWHRLNGEIHRCAANDHNTAVIATGDLKDKGDNIHFNSTGQRALGQLFAEAYLNRFYPVKNKGN